MYSTQKINEVRKQVARHYLFFHSVTNEFHSRDSKNNALQLLYKVQGWNSRDSYQFKRHQSTNI